MDSRPLPIQPTPPRLRPVACPCCMSCSTPGEQPLRPLPRHSRTYYHPALTHMSNTHLTATSSSNFQLIFSYALETYQKQTKKDLLVHPLAAQLQSCDSPSTILALLHQQVQDLNQSRSKDEKLTRWLDPTVNVLYAFSDTLGEGVSLVCPRTRTDV